MLSHFKNFDLSLSLGPSALLMGVSDSALISCPLYGVGEQRIMQRRIQVVLS